MHDLDYLASFGAAGDLGRFRATDAAPDYPTAYRRGDRVVVQSNRGVELASILKPARSTSASLFPEPTVGHLLRRALPEDESKAEGFREQAQALFARARDLS